MGRIVQSIQDGAQTVVWIPHYLYSSYLVRVQSLLVEAGIPLISMRFSSLTQMLPDDRLWFILTKAREIDRSEDGNTSRCVILINGQLIADHWKEAEWNQFIRTYTTTAWEAGKQSDIPRLLIFLPGVLELDQDCIYQHPSIKVIRWRGQVRQDDMHAFAHTLLHEQSIHSTSHRLHVSIISTLSGFDPFLCQFLCSSGCTGTESYIGALQRYAVLRKFELLDPYKDYRQDLLHWQYGIQDWMDGKRFIHSSRLRSDDELFQRRIWISQTRILFPLIEEERVKIIGMLEESRSIRFPMNAKFDHVKKTGDGEAFDVTFESASEMEIGPLSRYVNDHRVNQQRRIDEATKERVRLIKTMRDDLAHLKPLDDARVDKILYWHQN
jgi:hypothetical protein